MANFWAGVGDSLTFGATDWIRQQLGANEAVEKQSCAYRVGQYAEVAEEIALAGGSKLLTRMALRKSRKVIQREYSRAVRALGLRRSGYQVHHINPLLGHIGGKRAMFPVGGLPVRVHSGRWNLRPLDAAAHRQAHRRLQQMEQVLQVISNRYTTTLRVGNNLHRDFEQRCEE